MKHEPAAKLPWSVSHNRAPDARQFPVSVRDANDWSVAYATGTLTESALKAEYIAHAANAYPRLVKALRYMNHMGGDERGGYCICPRNDGSASDEKHASVCADARALLRELGEDA